VIYDIPSVRAGCMEYRVMAGSGCNRRILLEYSARAIEWAER